MNITRDIEFENELIRKIAEREFGGERTGVHCTDCYYCLNKQVLRRVKPIPSSKHEILLFSLGWATQRWLTGKPTDEDTKTVDGIQVTCDAILVHPWELKATYQGSEKPIEDNLAWIHQVMAQCYVMKDLTAHLTRFELMGNWKSVFGKKEDKSLPENQKPDLHAFRFEFTQAELDDNWAWTRMRGGLFKEMIEYYGTPKFQLLPKEKALPSTQAGYECSYCSKPYRELCEC